MISRLNPPRLCLLLSVLLILLSLLNPDWSWYYRAPYHDRIIRYYLGVTNPTGARLFIVESTQSDVSLSTGGPPSQSPSKTLTTSTSSSSGLSSQSFSDCVEGRSDAASESAADVCSSLEYAGLIVFAGLIVSLALLLYSQILARLSAKGKFHPNPTHNPNLTNLTALTLSFRFRSPSPSCRFARTQRSSPRALTSRLPRPLPSGTRTFGA